MPSVDTHPLKSQRRWGLAWQCALLPALMAAAGFFTAIVGWTLFAASGAMAALVAAGVCLLGGLATLSVCHVYTGPQRVLFTVAAGMFLRTSIPLVLALAVRHAAPDVFESGLMYFVLLDYLLCLAAETWLAVAKMENTTIKNAAMASATRIGEPARFDDTQRVRGIS